jgi:hypothetical protein
MKLRQHKFNFKRFGLVGNIKIGMCKVFGHQIGNQPTTLWCQRCGLAYEEIYFTPNQKNYYEEMEAYYKQK